LPVPAFAFGKSFCGEQVGNRNASWSHFTESEDGDPIKMTEGIIFCRLGFDFTTGRKGSWEPISFKPPAAGRAGKPLC
jgi:hypothetical protein